MAQQISYEEFSKLDLRVGTVLRAEEFPEARKPAYKVWVDFGDELGTRQTSAQITDLYLPDELVGRQVLAVVNLPPKRIAGFESQFLLTGFDGERGGIVLARPDQPVPNGVRLY